MSRTRIVFALLAFIGFASAQDREPPNILPSDPTQVIDFLTADAAKWRGAQFLNPNTNTPWFSDGTIWRDFASLAPSGTFVEAIVVINAANQVSSFPIGTTQTSRDAAAASAFTALQSGSTLIFPVTQQSFYDYELSETLKTIDRAVINFAGARITNKDADQDYILQFTGDGNTLYNFRGRTDGTSGNGDKLVFQGDYNRVINARFEGDADPGPASQFDIRESSLSIGNRYQNIYSEFSYGGLRLDGIAHTVDGATYSNCLGVHAIQSNSNVPGGSAVIRNVMISTDHANTNIRDSFGAINYSIMESVAGQWSSILFDNVVIDRKGTYNPLNVEGTAPSNISLIKTQHCESLIYRNCRVQADAPANGMSALIIVATDGTGKDVDSMKFDGGNINVPVNFQGSEVDRITLTGGVDMSPGNQPTIWYFSGVRSKFFDVDDANFSDGKSGQPFIQFTESNRIRFNKLRFDSVANAILFSPPVGQDMNQILVNQIENVQSSRLCVTAIDTAVMNAKTPNTWNRYRVGASGTPPVISSNYAMSAGAWATTDDPTSNSHYYWNEGLNQWVAEPAAADGNISTVALSGNNLNFTGSGGGFNGSVDLSSLGGSADGVVSNVVRSGTDLTFTGSNGGYNGTIDLSGLPGGSSDGVVSNVVLSGNNLNFTGSGGGFNGSVDVSSLGGSGSADGVVSNVVRSGNLLNFTGADGGFSGSIDLTGIQGGTAADQLVHLGSGIQSQPNKANAYDDLASVGPAPTAVVNGLYQTITKDDNKVNAYYSADKGGGLQWYAIPGDETPGIDDVLAIDQQLTATRSIELAGNNFLIDGGTTGNYSVSGVGTITNAASTDLVFTINGSAAVQMIKQETIALTASQTSIDVTNKYSIIVTSATTETLTGISGGVDGQTVTLHITGANISVADSTSLFLDQNDGNYTAQTGGAVFVIQKAGGIWREISRRIF